MNIPRIRCNNGLALLLALTPAIALAASDYEIEQLQQEGYELLGNYRVEHWYDEHGKEVDSGCTSGGMIELSGGLRLTCSNSGVTPSRDAVVLKKLDYYKVLVGSDTFQAHR